MELTKQQITAMQARGMDMPTIENIAKQKGYTLPKNQDWLEKTNAIVGKIFPGQKVGESIGTLAGYGISKLKGTSDFYDLSAPKPKQVIGDVLQGAASVAGAKLPAASSIVGKAAQFGGIGAVSGAGSAMAQDKSTAEVAQSAGKGLAAGALLGATFGVVEKSLSKFGNTANKVGQKIQYSVVRPSQADIKDGFKIDTIRKYNLGGSLNDTMHKTDSRMEQLSKELNAKLAKSNASINMNDVYENTISRLFGDRLSGFGSNTQLSNAAEKLRNEIVYSTGPNGLTSVPEAQVIKRAAGHYGAWQYGFQDPEAKASERVYNIFYNELKNEIERKSPPGVREINRQISELIPVMNAVIRRIPVAERNRGLSLTDIISLTAAVSEPRSLLITGLNFAQKSGRVGNLLTKTPNLTNAVNRGIGAVEQTAKTVLPLTR